MDKPEKLKCMRCGHEYLPPPGSNPKTDERTCPRCHSNSVRILKAEPQNKG